MRYKCVLGNIIIQNIAYIKILGIRQPLLKIRKKKQDRSHVMLYDDNITVIDNIIVFTLTRSKSHSIEDRLIN